jgi:hypothetical protein
MVQMLCTHVYEQEMIPVETIQGIGEGEDKGE